MFLVVNRSQLAAAPSFLVWHSTGCVCLPAAIKVLFLVVNRSRPAASNVRALRSWGDYLQQGSVRVFVFYLQKACLQIKRQIPHCGRVLVICLRIVLLAKGKHQAKRTFNARRGFRQQCHPCASDELERAQIKGTRERLPNAKIAPGISCAPAAPLQDMKEFLILCAAAAASVVGHTSKARRRLPKAKIAPGISRAPPAPPQDMKEFLILSLCCCCCLCCC